MKSPTGCAGLEVGADDYVAKPFSPRELTARVKAVLRRTGRAGGADMSDVMALGPVTLAGGSREVRVDGEEIELTQREFDLLEYLLRHAGQVVSRDQLLESVWGFRSPGETRTVEVHVAQLRKKLGRPGLIRTVRGLGYKATASRMTLRRRVLGYLALAAIASCALTVGVAVVLVRHKLATQRTANLEAQANVLALAGGAPGALTAGDHVYRVGAGKPKRVRPRVARLVLSALPTTGDGQGTFSLAGRSLIYAARRTANGRVVLIRGAKLAFSEWRPFLVSLVLAGLGGAALAALLSLLLARRLTRPIGELAAATERVAAGEPGVQVPVEGEDELAGLGRSFNAMSAELGRANESQRRFLESVSHELKTPLTSIRGYAEALQEGAVRPSRAGGWSPPRPTGWSAWCSTCLIWRVWAARTSRSRATRSISAAVSATAVQRHQPRARELGLQLTAQPTDDSGLGNRRRGPAAAGDVEPDRERAAPDARGRSGDRQRARRGDRGLRHRPRPGAGGPAPRL